MTIFNMDVGTLLHGVFSVFLLKLFGDNVRTMFSLVEEEVDKEPRLIEQWEDQLQLAIAQPTQPVPFTETTVLENKIQRELQPEPVVLEVIDGGAAMLENIVEQEDYFDNEDDQYADEDDLFNINSHEEYLTNTEDDTKSKDDFRDREDFL